MADGESSNAFIFVGAFAHSISLNQLELIEDGIIVVSDGKIALKDRTSKNLKKYQEQFKVNDSNTYNLEKGQFLVPGFIDTHIHAPQYPNIGLGYDLTLLDWLQTYTFPLETKFSDLSFAEKVYNAVVKRTLANGTTTACYYATIHKAASIALANAMKTLGQRGFVGKVNMNKNTPPGYGETYEESVNETKDFVEKVMNSYPMVEPIITPRFALSCDMKLMKALADLADKYKVPVQTHISENLEEIKQVKQEFSDCKNYLDVYHQAGLLNNKTILAHGIYLTEDELNVIKKLGATVAHCPSSNTLLKSGMCPVRHYLNSGIKVSLGTDCSGGSSTSMLDCIRQTLSLSIHASFYKMGNKLTHEEVFYMATLGGADALSLENKVGNFQPGKYFDAILVDLKNNMAVDILDEYNFKQLFEKFIYLGDDRAMKKVFVAGKVVKQ